MSPQKQLILSFVLLVIHSSMDIFTNGASLHTWKGDILYFQEEKVNLLEAIDICNKMQGHLPSVHSAQDVSELVHLLGQDIKKWLWLGAEPANHESPGEKFNYKWSDGSPFDFNDWYPGFPKCNRKCCGVAITNFGPNARRPHKMFDVGCYEQNYTVACVLPSLTKQAAFAWVNTIPILSEQINETLVKSDDFKIFEQQLTIELMNETLTNIHENQESVDARFDQLQSYIQDLHSSKNEIGSQLERFENQLANLTDELRQDIELVKWNSSQVKSINPNETFLLQNQVDKLANDLKNLTLQSNLTFNLLTRQMNRTETNLEFVTIRANFSLGCFIVITFFFFLILMLKADSLSCQAVRCSQIINHLRRRKSRTSESKANICPPNSLYSRNGENVTFEHSNNCNRSV